MTARTISILIVEDEALIAAMLQDMLEDLGARVVGPAYNLEHGCELARTAACDAAVLDVSLKGQTAGALAQILSQREVPFILATGYVGEISKAWPDVPVIEKPYSADDLYRALDAIGVTLAGKNGATEGSDSSSSSVQGWSH
jgi:CheY-like chemotaxis protein